MVGTLIALGGAVVVACDDSNNAVKEQNPTRDSGPGINPEGGLLPDGAPIPDGGPTDCVMNPKTHQEIINACTDAVKITKNPTLPLLYPDGGLPPLP